MRLRREISRLGILEQVVTRAVTNRSLAQRSAAPKLTRFGGRWRYVGFDLRRGKLHRPTEFGALVKVQEAEGGVVTDIAIVSTSHDSKLLVPSVERHIAVFGRAPDVAATDRGFFSNDGERRIVELGVRRAAIPHSGYRSKQRIAHERQRWLRRARAWRTGGEARISRLKNRFEMARSRYRGVDGMHRTVYWAAISNNLVAIARAA
jgi:IS5 family transposase